MPDEAILREKARAAVQRGKLPPDGDNPGLDKFHVHINPFARIAGGAELDAVHIIGEVLAKLLAGTLPKTYPSRVWVGDSTGVACDACDEPIEPRGVEYEVMILGVGVFRVHRKCFDVWNEEREWYLGRTTNRGPSLAEAVWALLESQRGQMFCAPCLASILGVTRRLDRALLAVQGRGGRRCYERCSMCGQDQFVCGLAAQRLPQTLPS